MSDGRLYIAVDLGAGSGRVILAGFQPDELMLEDVRRFHYPPRTVDGHLRWDATADPGGDHDRASRGGASARGR